MADLRGAIVVRDKRGQHRDPTAGTVNLSYTAQGAPMLPEWDAEAAFRSGYYANVFLYRCVQVRARALSALPFRVGADPAKPRDFDVNAPLAQLLGPPPLGPNRTTTARRLWAWTLAQKIVTGRFAWEIEAGDPRRPSRPTALWPLPSSQIKPIPTAGGEQYFSAFKFGPPNKSKTLTADQVVYAWNPSATDWREPESALQAARLDISIAIMQNRYDYAFLKNDARPAAVIVTQAFEDDEDYDRFKNQMMSEHRGVDNTGKLAFIEATGDDNGSVLGSVDIKTLGLSQTDAQFIAREEAKIRAICVALGVPLSKLGDASRRTFNNAGQETLNFETDTVMGDVHDLEDDINLLLAPLMGDGLVGWFDLSGLSASQSRKFGPISLIDAYKNGLIDLDEARGEVGFQPEDDTNEPAVAEGLEEAEDTGATLLERAQAFAALALTLSPESAAALTGFDPGLITAKTVPPTVMPVLPIQPTGGASAEAPSAQPPARDGLGEGSFGPGLLPTFSGSKHRPTGDKAGHCTTCGMPYDHSSHTLRSSPDTDDRAAKGEARRAAAWRDMDARATALEHTMAGVMSRLFARQASSTLTRLNGKRGRQLLRDLLLESRAAGDVPDASDLFDTAHWEAETEQATLPLYETITAQGAQAVAQRFGMSFDLTTEHVQAFIHARANQLAGQVTSTTYSQIQEALAQGVADGVSTDELAAAVRAVFDNASAVRSETIARTEVIGAYNGAQDMQGAQLPDDVVAGREWISTRDERTREIHADADGQTVARDAPFTVGDEDLQYPGDPNGSPDNVINCRCTFGYLTPDEMPADSNPGRSGIEIEYRTATALLRELVRP